MCSIPFSSFLFLCTEGEAESEAESGFEDDQNEVSDEDFDFEDFEGGGDTNNLIIDDDIGGDVDTYCYDSDDMGSSHSSDDESYTKNKFEEFNPARDMENPQFSVGQIFRDLNTFKQAIRAYSIKNKFPLRFAHSDQQEFKFCLTRIVVGTFGRHLLQMGRKFTLR
ncbi:unnamed protein product [Linum trigynum]|uniref:Transposase MuDR plant domain-containing protein n=1 Tax=Linum trigynum TaxID=586398 RepID=A0AAV2CLF8_9ROSI